MRTLLVLTLVSALALAGCASDTPSSPTPTPVATSPAATSPAPTATASPAPTPAPTTKDDDAFEVEIEDFAFVPATLSVPVGTMVMFENKDTAPHTATADDASWTTTTLQKGMSEAIPFVREGTFPYHCKIHPNMKGTIVVGDGVGEPSPPPATPTPPPATPTPPPPPVSPTPAPATPTPPPATPTPPPAPTPTQVDIHNFAFLPSSITVASGTTIRWTNADGAPHSATGDNNAFDTGVLDQGESGTATFSTAGTFGYFCKVHPSMRGTVTVTA